MVEMMMKDDEELENYTQEHSNCSKLYWRNIMVNITNIFIKLTLNYLFKDSKMHNTYE